MSYWADLAHAFVHATVAAVYLACIIVALGLVTAIGERHIRRVERRHAFQRWQRRESRARVVNVRERDVSSRALVLLVPLKEDAK